MPNIIVNTFLILLLATCGVILGSFYIQQRSNITYVNGKLYDLEHVVEALDILDPTLQHNQAVIEKLELVLARNLLDLSTKSIDINDIQETPTNVLCNILQYYKINLIDNDDSGSTQTNAIMELLPEYLLYLEKSLRNKAESSAIPYHHCNVYFGLKEE